MDFGNFVMLWQEGGLVAVFVLLLGCDIVAGEGMRRWFRGVACGLMALQLAWGFSGLATGEAFGGMFIGTQLGVMMKNVLTLGALLVFMQGGEWLRGKELQIREGEFYVIMTATLLGMYLMISAGNLMMLYVGIETASLPLACLAAYDKYKEKSAEAGAKFILISALSSGVMMFGMSYIYGATGTMYFADLAPLISFTPMLVLGFTFFLAGLAFKISLVPFHLWTADVYEGAPTAVTAYLSVVSKGAACFTLLLVLWRVFGGLEAVWHDLLWGLSVATIVVGNLFALRQKDIKRFLAYSSISQAGYILLGVMVGAAGTTAVVYYVLAYLFSNLAAFGVITAVENASGCTDIAAYDGFYRFNPRLSWVMTLALFSLAGIPPFAGFFSKFFVFAAAASQGEYLLVFIALANTVVSLYYYLLIVKAIFINPLSEHPVGRIRTEVYNTITLVVCAVALVALGILSGIYDYINL